MSVVRTPPFGAPFANAIAKLRRADRHRSEFLHRLSDWSSSGTIRLEVRPNEEISAKEGREVVGVWVVVDGEPPSDVRLALGDAVHCLRAALDHAMTETVVVFGGNKKRSDMPFHETRHNLADKLKNPPFDKIPDDIKVFLLDVVKPYKDGDFTLWALNKLDNVDKHRVIVPSVAVSMITGVSFNGGQGHVTRNFSGQVSGAGQIQGIRCLGPITNLVHGPISVAPFFDEPDIFDQPAEILPFFRSALLSSEQFIENLSALVYGQDHSP